MKFFIILANFGAFWTPPRSSPRQQLQCLRQSFAAWHKAHVRAQIGTTAQRWKEAHAQQAQDRWAVYWKRAAVRRAQVRLMRPTFEALRVGKSQTDSGSDCRLCTPLVASRTKRDEAEHHSAVQAITCGPNTDANRGKHRTEIEKTSGQRSNGMEISESTVEVLRLQLVEQEVAHQLELKLAIQAMHTQWSISIAKSEAECEHRVSVEREKADQQLRDMSISHREDIEERVRALRFLQMQHQRIVFNQADGTDADRQNLQTNTEPEITRPELQAEHNASTDALGSEWRLKMESASEEWEQKHA
eukprot:SAG31_NODE_7045_length_1805_cov_3.634232_2_plen_302_part_01